MKTINIFTGNRAEFGILFPIIKEFSKKYFINLIVSGAHLLSNWNTVSEIEEKVKELKNVKIHCLKILNTKNKKLDFVTNIPLLSKAYIEFKKNHSNDFLFILGDRIETFTIASTELYLEGKIAHFCGGDIANIPAFDTNVRHAITKMAHLHFVTNKRSYNTVKQLGEEDWRIANVGMPSLDIIKHKQLPTKFDLQKKYNLKTNEIVIATYHPDQYYNAETIRENFKEFIKGIEQVDYQVILTYPNNDPNYEVILDEIKNIDASNIKIVKSLGSNNYLGLLKHFNTIMAGNSSGILTESAFFSVPALLVGKRQIGRLRGKNVTEVINFTSNDIIDYINEHFNDYDKYSKSYQDTQYIYGNGNSGTEAFNFFNKIMEQKEDIEIQTKHFVELI